MSLARAFLDQLDPSSSSASLDAAQLEATLTRQVDDARRAWPDLRLDAEGFVGHVAKSLGPMENPIEALDAARTNELYLAYGCHLGDPRAMSALERTFGAHIEAAYRGLPSDQLSRDEFRQLVRDKLIVPDTRGQTKIGNYSGQGSLAAWLRITARRTGLNAVRRVRVPTASADEGDDPFDLPASLGNPELDYLKQRYQQEFREAFLEAVASLPDRARSLLRQSIRHRLTARQLGRMYQVHHATAARWVANARQQLVTETREALKRRLAVSGQELESIMRLIASRLDVSVARVLGPDEES